MKKIYSWFNQLSLARFLVWAYFVLLVVNVFLYSNSFKHPFIIDDGIYMQTNMTHLKYLGYHLLPDPKVFYNTAEAQKDVYYRPVAHVFFLLERVFFKDDVVKYHVTSFVIFFGAVVCLFGLLLSLFQHRWLAFLTSLFFSIHPINGFLVNYKTAVYFSIMMIFIILSLWLLWKGQQGKNVKRNYIVSLFLFVLSLLCHETAVALPLYAFGLLFFVKRLSFKDSLCKVSGFVIVLGSFLLFRMRFASLKEGVLSSVGDFQMNVEEYLASLTQLILWYSSKLFIPFGIFLTWTTSVVRELSFVWCGVFVGLILVWGWLLIFFYRKQRVASCLGLWWVFCGLLPLAVASLVQPPRGMMIEPFWLIMVSIGFLLLVADILNQLLSQGYWKIGVISIFVILICWSLLSFQANTLWSSEEKYCLAWKKEAPNCSPVNCHLARVYSGLRQFDKARYFQKQCLTSHPGDQFNYFNRLGLMDLREQKWEQAKEHFLKAHAIYPKEANVLTSLGALFYRENNLKKAKEFFEEARAYDAFSILPRINLATMALKENKKKEALDLYQEVLLIAPKDELAFKGLVQFYWKEQNKEECLIVARQLLSVSRDPQILTNLGKIFDYYGLILEAEKSFNKALEENPNNKQVYLEVSQFLIKHQRIDQAQALLKKAGLNVALKKKNASP